MIGGPPCQGFSPLNMLGVGLERRTLWREYLRALWESEPSVFVMENVPQLLRSGEYVAFKLAAEDLGFAVDGRILNAADYGVPQTRRRAIVIGSRLGFPEWPRQTHWAPDKGPVGADTWRTFHWAVTNPTPLPLRPTGTHWHNPRTPRPVSVERYKPFRAKAKVGSTSPRRPGHHSRLLAAQKDWLDRRIRQALVGPAGVHDPHRVLQAREGSIPASERAPANHRSGSGAMPELPGRLRASGGPTDDRDRQADRQRRPPLLAQVIAWVVAKTLESRDRRRERASGHTCLVFDIVATPDRFNIGDWDADQVVGRNGIKPEPAD